MIDLNSRSGLSDRINWLVDAGIDGQPEEQRGYLGCSGLGGGCERAVLYDYAPQFACPADTLPGATGSTQARGCDHGAAEAPADPWAQGDVNAATEAVFAFRHPARIRRVFERGQDAEDRTARWLKLAGFLLVTTDPLTGKQFEVAFCNGRVRGHADGILAMWRGAGMAPVRLPALWECKCLGHKWWQKARKETLRSSHPKYFAQMQLYMHGLHLENGLITCVDADTCELYHEQVTYDADIAVKLLQRAQRVLAAKDNGELLPRGETSPAAMACRMCRWSGPCWRA